jgi:hypothetical protein
MGLRDKLDGTTQDTFVVGNGGSGDKYILADPGGANLPGFRRLNSSGVWEYSNDGLVWSGFSGADEKAKVDSDDTTSDYLIAKLVGDGITFTKVSPGGNETLKLSLDLSNPGPRIIQVDPGTMLTGSAAVSRVISNGYSAVEFARNKTEFATSSIFWRRGPTTAVTVKVKFILKAAGSGSYARIAARIKARATGEDSSTAFDVSSFVAVPVTFTTLGQVFEAVITLSPATFADGDAVAFNLGRDGANTLGGGNNDDVTVPVQVIAIEIEVN